MSETSKIRKKKKNYEGFDSFIRKVLKQVHPDTGINSKSVELMNNIIRSFFDKIMKTLSILLNKSSRKTVTSREIQFSVIMSFHGKGKITKFAISEGVKSVTKYKESKKRKLTANEPRSTAYRASLQFPVIRFWNLMKKHGTTERVSKIAAIYIAAVLEYLTAEILDLAGNVARDNNFTRIKPRHIFLALQNDAELSRISCGMLMGGSHVLQTS